MECGPNAGSSQTQGSHGVGCVLRTRHAYCAVLLWKHPFLEVLAQLSSLAIPPDHGHVGHWDSRYMDAETDKSMM